MDKITEQEDNRGKIINKNGNVFTDGKEIMIRWKKYFKKLLHCDYNKEDKSQIILKEAFIDGSYNVPMQTNYKKN